MTYNTDMVNRLINASKPILDMVMEQRHDMDHRFARLITDIDEFEAALESLTHQAPAAETREETL